MNKKRLIKFIAIIIAVIVLVFIWLFISFWNGRKENLQQTNNNLNPNGTPKYPTARESVNWNAPFMKKIEVKFMNKEEEAKMGLEDDPMIRLQVLERDKNGKVTAYKKVYKDADIIQYVYDPNGAGTSTTSGAPASAANTYGAPSIN
jgi:hypothetical protein